MCILVIYISLPYVITFLSIKHAPTLSPICVTRRMQINALASRSAALAAEHFAKCPQQRALLYSHLLLHLDTLVIQDQTADFEKGVMVRERTSHHKNSEDRSWPTRQSDFVACNTLPLCHLAYRKYILFRNSLLPACRLFNKWHKQVQRNSEVVKSKALSSSLPSPTDFSTSTISWTSLSLPLQFWKFILIYQHTLMYSVNFDFFLKRRRKKGTWMPMVSTIKWYYLNLPQILKKSNYKSQNILNFWRRLQRKVRNSN